MVRTGRRGPAFLMRSSRWCQTGLVLLPGEPSRRLRRVRERRDVFEWTAVLLFVRLVLRVPILLMDGSRSTTGQPSSPALRGGAPSDRGRSFRQLARLASVTVVVSVSVGAAVGAAEGLLPSTKSLFGGEVLGLQGDREPGRLQGVPLRGTTGLRLVVADNPPFVLDVDTGSVTPVAAIPALEQGVVWTVSIRGQAAIVAMSRAWLGADLYAVRGREPQVVPLGTGWNVTAAVDGRSVWVQSFFTRSRCTLRRVALDGQELRPPRPFPCGSTSPEPGGSLGLVVRRTRVVDPLNGRTVFKTRQRILAIAGRKLVLAAPSGDFTLLDAATGGQRRLAWPSSLGWGSPGAKVDPRGRLVVLDFADPAWKRSAKQALDLWVLDTKTAKLTQLPSMPAFVAIKFTSMAWTDDGRLVLLAERSPRDEGGTAVVAVWRPGQRRLALKTVQLPQRIGGSNSFAPVKGLSR